MRKLLPLSDVAIIKPFDCGDDYLNNFLYEKAKACEQEYLTKTFVYEDDENTIAYISLLADKMSNTLIPKNIWRKLSRRIPHSKHFNSYPAIKIGCLAVNTKYRNQNIGSNMISLVTAMLLNKSQHVAFRFITVDAYLSAQSFYEKNDFVKLVNDIDSRKNTVPMYIDLKEISVMLNDI